MRNGIKTFSASPSNLWLKDNLLPHLENPEAAAGKYTRSPSPGVPSSSPLQLPRAQSQRASWAQKHQARSLTSK